MEANKTKIFVKWAPNFETSLALNDLHDTICITCNQFSGFYWVYTFIQVVHTEFIKVFCTEYSVFKSLSKMSKRKAAAAIIIALIYN